MKKILFVVIAIVILLGVGYFVVSQNPATQPSGDDMPGMNMNPSAGNSSETSNNTFIINSTPFSFSLKEIKVKVGETITIKIMASGQHTFTIDELGINQETPDNQMTNVTFTPDKLGTFTFYCAVPSHREKGQEGTIVVE